MHCWPAFERCGDLAAQSQQGRGSASACAADSFTSHSQSPRSVNTVSMEDSGSAATASPTVCVAGVEESTMKAVAGGTDIRQFCASSAASADPYAHSASFH